MPAATSAKAAKSPLLVRLIGLFGETVFVAKIVPATGPVAARSPLFVSRIGAEKKGLTVVTDRHVTRYKQSMFLVKLTGPVEVMMVACAAAGTGLDRMKAVARAVPAKRARRRIRLTLKFLVVPPHEAPVRRLAD
jgi:antitoxin (DNA-binding transcriptional repressor) of toxin-antitoxin stability system